MLTMKKLTIGKIAMRKNVVFVSLILLLLSTISFAQEPAVVDTDVDQSADVVVEADKPVAVDGAIEQAAEVVDTDIEQPAVVETVVEQPAVVETVVDEPEVVEPVVDQPAVVETVVDSPASVIVDVNQSVAVDNQSAVTAGSQPVAVYMSGEEPAGARGAHSILGAELAKVITQSDAYSAVDRTEAILEQIDREHLYQRSGAVSDEGIKELGRQFGVRYVCVASVSEAAGGFFLLEARLVDVETAEAIGVASIVSNLRDGREMIRTARRVAQILIMGHEDEEYAEEEKKLSLSVDANGGYVVTEFDGGLSGSGFQVSVGGEVSYRVEGMHTLAFAAGIGYLSDYYEDDDGLGITARDMALYLTPMYRFGSATVYLEASLTVSASFFADVEIEFPDGSKRKPDVELSAVYSFGVGGRYRFAGAHVGRSFSDEATLVGVSGYVPVFKGAELIPAFTYYIGDGWNAYAVSLGARVSF